ncbi:MAG: hypothetical protein HYV97_08195 [Bdellovibrio sp.]|nr:hypothetical protein [Bdellovibrio sp.]
MAYQQAAKKILFTSVWRPIGPSVGDGESVGYELLHGQVTRAQGIYSPRVVHKQFSLDYIAENIDSPSKVLHYPSKARLRRELQKNYDVVAIAFVLSTSHHAIAMCQMIRAVAPKTKIILGGYGTVMSDEELLPYCDSICREEGVTFMRKYLGQPTLAQDQYVHPDIFSRMRIFGIPVSVTGMVFAGLGCPNACDFCCTSHFFKNQHIRLLPTGKSIFELMNNQRKKYPDCDHTILDEDFLLSKTRAQDFLDLCRKNQVSFSTFCFASVKALKQYTCDELLEMGIDGVWVGYEGKAAGYEKHRGVNIDEFIKNLQAHGITVLTSMIVGIPYQSDEVARAEFDALMRTNPSLSQFLIYGPIPGTPFYEKVMKEELMHGDLIQDRRQFYKQCTGFYAMMKHPFMRRNEIEQLQRDFYQRDFEILGPSIFRIAQIKLNGYLKYHNHPNSLLRKKSECFRQKLMTFLAILPCGILGPNISWKLRLSYSKLFIKILGMSNLWEKRYLMGVPVMLAAAAFTWINRKLNLHEHPFTRIFSYQGRKQRPRPSAELEYLSPSASYDSL